MASFPLSILDFTDTHQSLILKVMWKSLPELSKLYTKVGRSLVLDERYQLIAF